MKKILLLLLVFASILSLKAQNIQTHYDFGKSRKCLTTTVEMFKPDKHGSTFFFIDMNYGENNTKGVSLAYWEIARGLKFWNSPFEIHLEYDGGFGQWQQESAYQISDAWLFGGNYTWNTADFSKVFTLQAMYKNIRQANYASFQLTGVWTLKFMKDKVTFCGFADFWRENTSNGDFIFLTEPQIWYNFNKNFAVGSEIEISSNFGGHDGGMVNPTIAAKYTF